MDDSEGCTIKGLDVPFSRASDLHGHACPGLILGYKAAIRAMKELRPAIGHPLAVTAYEGCGCPIDALRAVTGCAKEDGTLEIVERGEAAFRFSDLETGGSVTISLLPDFDPDCIEPGWGRLRKRLNSGEATGEERGEFEAVNARLCRAMLELPDEAIIRVEGREH